MASQNSQNLTERSINIHCINVVWGTEYVRLFLDYSLPLQLTKGNLGALKGRGKYRIFTTNPDRHVIENDAIFQQLCAYIQVDFVEIETPAVCDKIHRMNTCHRQAIQDAASEDAALVFLCPDILVSDCMFEKILASVSSGKRAIMVLSVRVLKEDVCLAWAGKRSELQGFSCRDLARLALRFLHPVSRNLIWNRRKITALPSHLYWKINEDCLLARGFHLHPIFIWPESRNSSFHTSVDFDCVAHCCPSSDNWEVIEDSDEMAVFEMSPQSLEYQMGSMDRSISLIAIWASYHTKSLHHDFARKRIYIHCSDIPSDAAIIAKQSDKVIEQIIVKSQKLSLWVKFIWFCYRLKNKIRRTVKKLCLKQS